MKSVKASLSVLAVLVLICTLAGCGPQEVVTPGGQKAVIGSGGETYATAGEAEPRGEMATELNDLIKPILIDVFGGAKLHVVFTHSGETGVVLNYIVKRSIKNDDLASVISKLEAAGYTKILDLSDEDMFMVQVASQQSYIMAIEGSFNENDISFSMVSRE